MTKSICITNCIHYGDFAGVVIQDGRGNGNLFVKVILEKRGKHGNNLLGERGSD